MNRERKHWYKILNFFGIMLLAVTFILVFAEIIEYKWSVILLMISIIAILPDSIFFTVREAKKSHGNAMFWWSKFLALPFILLCCMLAIFILW